MSHLGMTEWDLHNDPVITQITMDSRKVHPGALFVCTPGTTRDSHSFLAAAAEKGAVAAATHSKEGERIARELGLFVFPLAGDRPHFHWSILRMCSALYDSPTAKMKTVGVTGTNGKTTTAWLIRDLLLALQTTAAYIGTLGYQRPGFESELSNTTPFPTELFELIADAHDAGVAAIAMEVSSHALAENRVLSTMFDVGVFTNLTQDHLDFHKTFEAYECAKWKLFEEVSWRPEAIRAVINIDDAVGRQWAAKEHFAPWSAAPGRKSRLLTFGHDGDFEVRNATVEVDRIAFDLKTPDGMHAIEAPLGSAFNVQNLVAAVAAVFASGYSIPDIVVACAKVRPVPGRFEPVPNDHGVSVIIDYAHTPDAIVKLLDAARPLTKGRLITVFGCGGDRDRTKRPLMAEAASSRSDVTIVTSDNPRTEDPAAIIDEVMTGIVEGRQAIAISDRAEAIRRAIAMAVPGDVVAIAGKGHENYQIIGHEKFHLSDRELASESIAQTR